MVDVVEMSYFTDNGKRRLTDLLKYLTSLITQPMVIINGVDNGYFYLRNQNSFVD